MNPVYVIIIGGLLVYLAQTRRLDLFYAILTRGGGSSSKAAGK